MLVELRKWLLAAIAVSVVFLGGCASTPEPSPTVTVTAPTPAPVDSNQALYDAYTSLGLILNFGGSVNTPRCYECDVGHPNSGRLGL